MDLLRFVSADTYLGRLLSYAVIVGVSSIAGAVWIAEFSPVGGPMSAIFSLGPALLVVSLARLSPVGVVVVATIAAGAMMVMFRLYEAAGQSSTAALVFMWGWVFGLPVALLVVAVAGPGERWGQRLSPNALHGVRVLLVVVGGFLGYMAGGFLLIGIGSLAGRDIYGFPAAAFLLSGLVVGAAAGFRLTAKQSTRP